MWPAQNVPYFLLGGPDCQIVKTAKNSFRTTRQNIHRFDYASVPNLDRFRSQYGGAHDGGRT